MRVLKMATCLSRLRGVRPTSLLRMAALAAAILALPASANAELLWADSFDTGADISLDAAKPAGASRLSGTVALETELESFGVVQNITADELNLVGGGGARFGAETNRYDWAGASTGSKILAAGGFEVAFDWIHDGTSTEWIAWKVGTPNGDSGVNAGDVDHAVLIRHALNGASEENERWDNGGNLGYSGVSYGPNSGTLTSYPVVLTYSFNSFADGSPVNLVANVNGVDIVNDNFTWDGNSGSLFMELATGTPNNAVDNLSVSTQVPEPTTIALAGLGLVGLIGYGRRRK